MIEHDELNVEENEEEDDNKNKKSVTREQFKKFYTKNK